MIKELLIKRHRFNKLINYLGIASISLSCLFLVIFIGTILYQAIPAFSSYHLKMNLNHSMNFSNEKESEKCLQDYIESGSKYNKFFSDEAVEQLIQVSNKKNRSDQQVLLLASAKLNNFMNNAESNYFSEQDKDFIKKLLKNNLLEKKLNWNFFFHNESSHPEIAGIATAVIGSLYTIAVCILFAMPIAIASAIYLEEFAPKNLLTSLIEVNINNLAAIPSIVFGLLGLAILINVFALPRSTAIVAGITLASMVLPIMIISTRQALSTIPISIKHAALALGATKTQVILHHTLPLALPGIMTGIILSIARAVGETAPLILLGMAAFIVDIPKDVFDPTTVLPIQIFLWTQNPDPIFHAKTAGAILVLLGILIIFNIIAVTIRKKYEHRW